MCKILEFLFNCTPVLSIWTLSLNEEQRGVNVNKVKLPWHLYAFGHDFVGAIQGHFVERTERLPHCSWLVHT